MTLAPPHTRDHWKCRDSSASSERRFWLIRPSPRHVRSADYSICSPASIFIIPDDVCLFNEGAVTRRGSSQITGRLSPLHQQVRITCLSSHFHCSTPQLPLGNFILMTRTRWRVREIFYVLGNLLMNVLKCLDKGLKVKYFKVNLAMKFILCWIFALFLYYLNYYFYYYYYLFIYYLFIFHIFILINPIQSDLSPQSSSISFKRSNIEIVEFLQWSHVCRESSIHSDKYFPAALGSCVNIEFKFLCPNCCPSLNMCLTIIDSNGFSFKNEILFVLSARQTELFKLGQQFFSVEIQFEIAFHYANETSVYHSIIRVFLVFNNERGLVIVRPVSLPWLRVFLPTPKFK